MLASRPQPRRSATLFQMKSIVNSGNLLPDSIILAVLQERLAEGRASGERGVLLDGFPRTRAQVCSFPNPIDAGC